MQLSIDAIARMVSGECTEEPQILEQTILTGVASLESAQANDLSFFYSPKYLAALSASKAGAIIIPKDSIIEAPPQGVLIRVSNAYYAFNQILTLLQNETKPPLNGIHPTAVIAPTAQIAENVYIGAHCVIEDGAVLQSGVCLMAQIYIGRDTLIARNTLIHPNVTIYHKCTVGTECIIHAGSVIGSDGFGFLKDDKGNNVKIPQVGKVVIEDYVEIGANTTIDRATLDTTYIRKGVKIDNLVQVGHNVSIDQNTVIAALAGIAGGVKIGKNCMIGGQVGFVGHITIADGVSFSGQSGVSKSVTQPNIALRGTPATELKNQIRIEVIQRRLPKVAEQVDDLEARIEELNQKIENLK